MHASKTPGLVLCALAVAGLCSAQVPPIYQDLYAQLTQDIADLQGSVSKVSDGSTFPVTFSAQLTAANSNNGPQLLQPASFTLIQSEIQSLKALGVKAVSVEMSFPMLYAPFFNSIGQPAYQSQFTTFYANVAAAIRAQGMQVIVESQSMIPTGLQSVWGTGLQSFYASLTTFPEYTAARAQAVKTVAQTMQPDYFVLQEEPDTEAAQSGQSSAGAVSGSTTMLSGSIAAARDADIPGMKVGAGLGPWLQSFQLFANSFTRQHCGQTVGGQIQPCISQPMDFLDLHLFPITQQTVYCTPPPNPKPCTSPNFGQNALAIVSTAQSANMPMSISQCWLRKTRDAEWLQVNGDFDEAREAYSFWQPLDHAFLQLVYSLANYSHMLFVVPFNTPNYFAYLAWTGGDPSCTVKTTPACTALQGEGGGNSPALVYGAAQNAAIAVLSSGSYTMVGSGYKNLITSSSPFTVRLAAAGQAEPFATQSIVAAYGSNLSAGTATATAPSTTLNGTTVTVTDSASTSHAAVLFYVSPAQVDFEIPGSAAPGPATVTIRSQSGAAQSAAIEIGSVSPGLFQLSTTGLVAAWALPIVSGVQQNLVPVYQLDTAQNVVPLPLDLGSGTQQYYLELYGTGIRNAKTVTVSAGGTNLPVLFVGAAPGFTGLDQVNVGPLPRSLAGQNSVSLVLTADNQSANLVTIDIK
jgi:uncharacterized protein (TIGR03437 family)